jgi:uncharacterized membrane protein
MEILVFVFALILFIMLLDLKKTFTRELDKINYRLDHITAALNKLKTTEGKAEKPVESVKPVSPPEPVKQKEIIPPAIVERPSPPKPEPQEEKPPVREKEPEVIKIPGVIEQRAPAPREVKQEEPRPSFFERNPDLEKFIGENLANKIGIAILVLGIGFFVKYAIDQEWIGIYGRVFIGILCGGILIGIAHRLRKTLIAFSSVMVGGGIAVLYLTITIAFHTYGIMSQEIAFGIMVLITGFTIILSIAYDRIELAILAILGGFGSPFMVSTGEGNYVILFTYIMILDVGMLVLAFFKKWRLVNIIAYVFTIVLFSSWLAARFDGEQPGMMTGAIIFATLFYVIFFVMNIINNIRKRVAFEGLEYLMLLSNTFLYYSAGMYILNNPDGEAYKGLFTAVVAIFNFGFAFALYKNEKVDRNLVFLLIGLVLTFLSLAAPIQLEGNYITLFWTAEAVLLLWLSQKSGIKLIKIASLIVMLLMWVSLVMDWYNVYVLTASDSMLTGSDPLRVLLNKGYLTSVFSLIGLVLCIRLLRNETEYAEQVANAKSVFTFAAVIILYLSNLFELRHHLEFFIDDAAGGSIIVGLYNAVFILGLMLVGSRLKVPDAIRPAIDALGLVAISSYLIFYHREVIESRDNFLFGTASFAGFGIHYLYLILLIVAAVLSLNKIRKWNDFNAETYNAYSWFFMFFFVFLASAELDHTVLLAAGATEESQYHILRQNHKIGYPILWGIASFILIAAGLRMKLRHLRIISLTLFLITLVKLFLVDIRGISEGGKIAAFISLGVLLLIVSFMYQRLKKLLL